MDGADLPWWMGFLYLPLVPGLHLEPMCLDALGGEKDVVSTEEMKDTAEER